MKVKTTRKTTKLLFAVAASLLFIPNSARAQQPYSKSNPSDALAPTQKEGRRIFQQRCAICHMPPTVVAKRYGPVLYKEIVEDNEDAIRDTILEGREALMPGFKYGLARPEIEAIIEYLKTVKRPAPRPKSSTPASGNPEGGSSPSE